MRRLPAAAVAFALLSETARADTTAEADVGATYIGTRTEAGIPDCEREIIDRRLAAALRPSWRSRDETLSGRANIAATVPEKGEPEVFDSEGEISYTVRAGLHRTELTGRLGYEDQLVSYGCSSTFEARLTRARDLSNGTVLRGSGLRSRSLGAAHAIGREASLWTTRYQVDTQEAAGVDTRHELSLRNDRTLSRALRTYTSLRAGNADGALEKASDVGLRSGAFYSPDTRLGLGLDLAVDGRDDGGRTFTENGGLDYKITRQSQAYAQLSSNRFVRQSRSSRVEGELGMRLSPRWTELTIAAHRLEIDDASGSNGNWYTVLASRTLTPRQVVGGKYSTGSPFPDQARLVTSWLASYGLRLGRLGGRGRQGGGQGGPTPRGELTMSYSVSRVFDLADQEVRVRQWALAVTGTF